MVEEPDQIKRTVADIIANISFWKDRLTWVFRKDLKPRVLFGLKSDGTPIDIHDVDGVPIFTSRYQRATLLETEAPITNADPSIPVPADEVWDVFSILAMMNNAVAVADRAFTVNLTSGTIIAGGLAMMAESDVVTLSSDQNGIIYVTQNSIYYNDNGTGSHGDDSFLPTRLTALDSIKASSTNKDTGDRMSLAVLYRKVQ